jgi:5-formyltetrahydrofolate cyclo-ligase
MSLPDNPKATLRSRLRQALRELSPESRSAASGHLRTLLELEPAWQSARTLLAFVPLRSEPDVWPSILAAAARGVTVCLPRHDLAADGYRPCRVPNLERDLRPGPHGVLEPAGDCPWEEINQLDFILVPGVGFAPSGGRLGRGKGYYDRMLAAAPGLKCGVAFDLQVIPELPLEPHDVRLDLIITESRRLTAIPRVSS